MGLVRSGGRRGAGTGAAAAAALVVVVSAGCASAAHRTGSVPPGGGSGSPTAARTSSPGRTTSTSALGEAAPCRTNQLSIQVNAFPGAAGGRHVGDVVVTNQSGTACTVRGSVTLTLADSRHQAIVIPTGVFPGNPGETPGPATTVTLQPGGSAAESFDYSSTGDPAPGQSACAPIEAFFVIAAPGDRETVPVPVPSWGRGLCPHDSLTLSNLVPGSYSPPF